MLDPAQFYQSVYETSRCANIVRAARKNAFDRLREREDWDATYDVYLEQHMREFDRPAYEELLKRREIAALRKEVKTLTARVDSIAGVAK